MHAPDRFPMHVDQVDPGADYVLEPGAGIFERLGDDFEDRSRLRRGVADRDRLAARSRRRAADRDDAACAHRPRKADDRLVRAARRYQTALAHRLVQAALLHRSCGLASGPAASSIARPTRNSVSSSNALPMSWSPSGVPSEDSPAGTLMPGRPAIFTVTVKMSLRYISSGSPDFSPSAKAGPGVVGVRIASTVSNAVSKSHLIKVRTFCALR